MPLFLLKIKIRENAGYLCEKYNAISEHIYGCFHSHCSLEIVFSDLKLTQN